MKDANGERSQHRNDEDGYSDESYLGVGTGAQRVGSWSSWETGDSRPRVETAAMSEAEREQLRVDRFLTGFEEEDELPTVVPFDECAAAFVEPGGVSAPRNLSGGGDGGGDCGNVRLVHDEMSRMPFVPGASSLLPPVPVPSGVGMMTYRGTGTRSATIEALQVSFPHLCRICEPEEDLVMAATRLVEEAKVMEAALTKDSMSAPSGDDQQACLWQSPTHLALIETKRKAAREAENFLENEVANAESKYWEVARSHPDSNGKL